MKYLILLLIVLIAGCTFNGGTFNMDQLCLAAACKDENIDMRDGSASQTQESNTPIDLTK